MFSQKAILDKLTEIEKSLGDSDDPESRSKLKSDIDSLRRQISQLQIEKSKIKEEHAREERETKHKVGLNRLRFEQEQREHEKEVGIAKREAQLEVREGSLQEERDRFEKQMDFITGRLNTEVNYIQDILAKILDRLPTVSVNGVFKSNGDNNDGSSS